ncbi:hypothetical protein, partial [Pseudomonas sp. MD332_6]|uniref:hypothetical protein n=1 Tax=Pseudomonas sp. MD332_6 TaxID=3241256 RepID=UPI0036D2117B
LVTDAFCFVPFIRAVILGVIGGTRLACRDGVLRFDATEHLAALQLTDESPVRYLSSEKSNRSVVVVESMVLNFIRKFSAGVHP